MSTIITKFVRENNLSPEMSLSELSQHVPEMLELLTDKKGGQLKGRDIMPPGKTTDTQLEEGAVNVYQVSQEETIRELAQRIV
ncbi:hypothetical protein C1646_778237 [Rhizophagus diaphanus]|nr:hypothetical protein C1646_778237 [Rhizophagus diaphanus] [Rhizophagus sp. MUCL 43196]